MKNFKKIVAAMAAASMMLSLSVAAFADSATYNADTETVSVTCADIDAANQWTVIIIDADENFENNDDLDADDLHYINQGTVNDTFWTAMGTKEALTAGNYLVRIGGTTLDNVIEIPLTVLSSSSGSEQTITITLGDIDGNGEATAGDITYAVIAAIGGTDSFTNADDVTFTYGSDEITITDKTYIMNGVVWGDVDGNGEATAADITYAVIAAIGGNADFTFEALNETYTYGEEMEVTITEQ